MDPKTLDRLAQALVARMLPLMPHSNDDLRPPKIPQRMLNTGQAAHFLGMSERALYNRVARREVPFSKFGRSLKFDLIELSRYIRRSKR